MSPILIPLRLSASRVAPIGSSSMITGSPAVTVMFTIRAIGVRLKRLSAASLTTSAPDAPWIVTRTAPAPTGPWSTPKVQLTWGQNPFMYGGFIYPRSTRDNLLLMISTWIPPDSGLPPRYDVSVFKGTL